MKYNIHLIWFVALIVFGCGKKFSYLTRTVEKKDAYNQAVNGNLSFVHIRSGLFTAADDYESVKTDTLIRRITPGLRKRAREKFAECLPKSTTDKAKYSYAIRKVEMECDTPGVLKTAYQLYWFAPMDDSGFFSIYFQSDAFFKKDIDVILNDIRVISSNYNNPSKIQVGDSTRLSYFVGIYFHDLDEEGHLQLNLCSPHNQLGDRKVFRINCCPGTESDTCDILPDNNSIATKTYEYRLYNPDKIFATSPYSLYYRSRQQLENWAKHCEPKVPLSENTTQMLVTKRETDTACICNNKFRERVVYKRTTDFFRSRNQPGQAVFSIFLDRKGDLYPAMRTNTFDITCANVCDFYASVRSFYETKTGKSFHDLENRQMDTIARIINNLTGDSLKDNPDTRLTFLVMGANNNYEESQRRTDSLIRKIVQTYTPSNHVFIKVYWDGTQVVNDPKDTSRKSVKQHISENFPYATGTSYEVGDKLRKLIRRLKTKNIYFISHGLGANVVCEALFNQLSKVPSRLQKESKRFYLQNDSTDSEYAIAQGKNFHAALIGPTVPGENTFNDLFDREINKLAEKNEYHFIVGTHRDTLGTKPFQDLKEELGNYFASCTLGFDPEDNANTQKRFQKEKSERYTFKTIAFSEIPFSISDTQIPRYLKHESYDRIILELYGDK